ncbi:MAG: PAS domain-containing protein, partial [Cytophagaceae bacterium]|nr:PAS domain-containing protein [Cytophagaceae bacterium]
MTPPSSESGLNLEPVGTPPGAFSETPLLGARESVHFIRRLMHLAPDIVYVYDYRTQKLLYVNHRLTDVLGYTEADLPALNYSLVNLVIAPDPQQLGAYLDQRFADADETVEYEFTVRHKDGSPRVMRTRGSVLRRDETGQPAEVMGISEDVTAEHRSLAARRRSAAQLNESQRLFHYGSWDWKVSEERVCYSDELFRIFGYDPAEFPDGFAPRNFYLQHVPEAEREAMNEQVWGAIDAGKSYEVEHNLLARDGTHKRLRLRGSLFFDETGTLTEIHGTAADITASYEAAQHLRESEALRNDTERFFGYGSWVWDLADPQNTYWSEGNIRLFGYQPHEVPGGRTTIEFFLRHVHPDDRERIIDTARQAVERHEDNLTQEYRAITRTGDVRYFLRRARLVYDEHGQPLRFMGQTADVTDERQLAEALRQSERLNRRLNELSPDFISLYDVKTSRNRYIGRHLREVLGYSEKEVGKHGGNLFFAIEGEEDWALVRDFSAKIASLHDYDYLTYKVRMRAKDGRRVVIQSRSTVFRRGEEGQVAELMAVTQDVTEAETQAEALRQSEAFNRRLLELSPDVIGLYDLPTRRSRYVSDHTLPEWFGYTPEEVEALGGNLLGQFWTEADKAQFDAGFAQSLRTIAEGELISFLMNMRRKDGTLLVLFVRVSVIRCDDEGRPLELMSIYQNVTEREHLLDQLQRNEALLSQTEESLLFGSWEWDVPTGQITWSAGLWRIFGYDDREGSHPVTTDVLFGHLHPDDQAMIEAVNRKALAEPEPFGFEYRITDAHGQARVLAGRGVPLFDGQGRFARLVGTTHDITAEKKASDLLRKQELLLREAESLLRFGSWEWNVPGGEVIWSEGMYAVFGYGPDNRPNPMTIGVLAGHLHPDDAGENTRV